VGAKIALVHDWLTGMRGGEKVLEVFCELLPGADIFTLVHVPGSVSRVIEERKITASVLNRFPLAGKKYRYYLPLMPWAVERLDLQAYDLVVSVSHCAAKGVRARMDAVHICCCLTPMRYIWDQYDEYFGPGSSASLAARMAMRYFRPRLQAWDRKSSEKVAHFIAISNFVAERIRKLYGRESTVICPHADTDFFVRSPALGTGRYYLVVSAFAPYKKLDLAVRAFSKMRLPLKVVGTGQDEKKLKRLAGPTVQFVGWAKKETLRELYQDSKALIFPGVEDYGIVPLEAMACGRPVIALAAGGALETVVENRTGIFFHEPTEEALSSAVSRFERSVWDSGEIRRHAEQFSRDKYREKLRLFLLDKVGHRFDLGLRIS
jgi:glycosyltransferase involved in cell wall biosynthesis